MPMTTRQCERCQKGTGWAILTTRSVNVGGIWLKEDRVRYLCRPCVEVTYRPLYERSDPSGATAPKARR